MLKFIVALLYFGFNVCRAKALFDKGAKHYIVGLNLFFGFFIWLYGKIRGIVKK